MVELPIVAFGQSWCEAKYSSEERRERECFASEPVARLQFLGLSPASERCQAKVRESAASARPDVNQEAVQQHTKKGWSARTTQDQA